MRKFWLRLLALLSGMIGYAMFQYIVGHTVNDTELLAAGLLVAFITDDLH